VENFKPVRFVLIYTMILNLVATGAKIVVGYATGSLSILADGVDSFFDSVSNVIGLVAIYMARRPADEDHPYGHRRYEILLTLSVSVLLFFTCFQLLRTAYQRFRDPIVPEINIWSFASLAVSIAVHMYVTVYEEHRGRELKSEFLLADAMHTRADILVSVGVAAGLVVVRIGYPIIDTALAVVIAFFIAKIGVDIIRSSTRILTDAAALKVPTVARIIQEVPEVQSFHHVRSRGQEDDVHLDLHIRVAPDMPLQQAHSVAHDVQRRLQQEIPSLRDVIIHVEPQRGTAGPSHPDLSATVRRIASSLGLMVHEVDAREIDGHYSLQLHLEVSETLTLTEAHEQASLLEAQVKAQMPAVAEISTHIEPSPVRYTAYDQVADDAEVAQRIGDLVGGMTEVNECHGVQVTRIGGRISLTLHCVLDDHLPIAAAHDIATLVEDRLRRECTGLDRVTVHVEPETAR